MSLSCVSALAQDKDMLAVLRFRLVLIDTLARTLRSAMDLLGIQLPDRM